MQKTFFLLLQEHRILAVLLIWCFLLVAFCPASAAGLLIDDFEADDALNNLGGEYGQGQVVDGTTPSIFTRITNEYSAGGKKSLQLSFDTTEYWAAWWTFLRSDKSGFDLSSYKDILFWTRDADAQNFPRVSLTDVNENTKEIETDYYFEHAGSGDWKHISIPLEDFSASVVDLTEVKTLTFGLDSSATIYIDQIELQSAPEYELQESDDSAIITELLLNRSSFSPNGDGIKDTAVFSYTLSCEAKFSITFYNLAGEIVRKEDNDGFTLSPGKYVFEWEGEDDSGGSVQNGVYIYCVSATDNQGKQEKLTRLIEVMR